MAKGSDIIKGLTILAKYEDEGIDTHIGGADHDIIYGFAPDEDKNPISTEDIEALDSAGWFRDDEGWSCFV